MKPGCIGRRVQRGWGARAKLPLGFRVLQRSGCPPELQSSRQAWSTALLLLRAMELGVLVEGGVGTKENVSWVSI